MYPNFIEDRKTLGYEVLRDTSCGMKLGQITDSIVPNLSNIDRETSWIFVYPSKLKGKAKKIIVVIVIGATVWFSNLESVEAIGLTMIPTPVVRVQPSLEHPLKKTRLVIRKPDRVSYKCFYESKEELLLLIYATDPRLSSN